MSSDTDDSPVLVTRPLLDVLLELARDADPQGVSIGLTLSRAGDLDPSEDGDRSLAELDEDTPVFADFYFPETGASIEAVFGMDLSTPVGVAGRFISHPDGDPEMRVTDDFAARVLLAIPPYERDSVRAYDRRGRRDFEVIAAASPEPEAPT